MRKVTKQVVAAFMQRKSRKVGNTQTDGTTLWLHGNAIARWQSGSNLEVSFSSKKDMSTYDLQISTGIAQGSCDFVYMGVALQSVPVRSSR